MKNHSVKSIESKSAKKKLPLKKIDKNSAQEFRFREQDLIRLFPFGMQISTDGVHPVLILKDSKGGNSMPVQLNALEAGVTLSQSSKNTAPMTVHKVSELLLGSLNIKVEKCIFVEIKGSSLFVLLQMSGHPQVQSLKLRADEAMSLCLHLNVPFFATAKLAANSRVLSAELMESMRDLLNNPELQAKNQKYMM